MYPRLSMVKNTLCQTPPQQVRSFVSQAAMTFGSSMENHLNMTRAKALDRDSSGFD